MRMRFLLRCARMLRAVAELHLVLRPAVYAWVGACMPAQVEASDIELKNILCQFKDKFTIVCAPLPSFQSLMPPFPFLQQERPGQLGCCFAPLAS